MMDTAPLIVALVAMIPLMTYVIWSDMRTLRIPNWVVLAVLAIFLVTGLWGLPLETFLWRLAQGFVVLFIGFGIYALAGGKVGGGDMKLIAALVPFIAGAHVLLVVVIYTIVTFAALFVHRLVRARLRGRQTGWIAVDQKIYFPVGLILGLTILIYLGLRVADRLHAPVA